jgi:hypothetical protein
MESILGRQRLILPIAPAIAAVAAALVALAFIAMPANVLEGMVVDSGIASLVTAAGPPLGLTARFAIAAIAAGAIGGVLWFGLLLLIGTRSVVLNRGTIDADTPVVRRADAHPDAPPRRPVFANRDLGTPFLDIRAEPGVTGERPIPADLDTPLAQYLHPLDKPLPAPPPQPMPVAPQVVAEPAPLPIRGEVAIEPVPAAIIAPPVPSMPEPAVEVDAPPVRFAQHERIETFELTPMVRTTSAEPSTPLAPATIHDLLERLERGVARRAPIATEAPAPVAMPTPVVEQRVPEGSLQETLGVLRQLAAQVG